MIMRSLPQLESEKFCGAILGQLKFSKSAAEQWIPRHQLIHGHVLKPWPCVLRVNVYTTLSILALMTPMPAKTT